MLHEVSSTTPIVCSSRCHAVDGMDTGDSGRHQRILRPTDAELPCRPHQLDARVGLLQRQRFDGLHLVLTHSLQHHLPHRPPGSLRPPLDLTRRAPTLAFRLPSAGRRFTPHGQQRRRFRRQLLWRRDLRQSGTHCVGRDLGVVMDVRQRAVHHPS